MTTEPEVPSRTNRRIRRRLIGVALALPLLAVLYCTISYVVAPAYWRHSTKRHPAIGQIGGQAGTRTSSKEGIPADPLNIAIIGNEAAVQRAMRAAGWYPADPITLKSAARIAADSVMHRAYIDAPISNLYLFSRAQDLAFEQPIGTDPRRRHHVRYWRAPTLDEQRRPLWFGATTLDTSIGVSRTTGQITHHIDPAVDAERDKLVADLQRGANSRIDWAEEFQAVGFGTNGGGDPYSTDRRLAIVTVD